MIRNAREFLPVELDFGRFNHLRLVREDVVAAGRHIVSFPAGEYDKQSHPMRKKKLSQVIMRQLFWLGSIFWGMLSDNCKESDI